MRDASRVLVCLTLGASLSFASPVAVAAAPVKGAERSAAEDPRRDELPLDTDDDELDTDDDELDDDELDTDELDTDELDTDAADDELDTDDAPPPPRIEDTYNPLRDGPEARAAKRLLVGGITAMLVGAALVGGATALGLTDPCHPAAGNNCFTDARNRGALTMGIPGAVLVLGGVVMTAVAGVRKRRLWHNAAAGVVSGRDHIGVVVVGRF
jgi:hypothetical protein